MKSLADHLNELGIGAGAGIAGDADLWKDGEDVTEDIKTVLSICTLYASGSIVTAEDDDGDCAEYDVMGDTPWKKV